MKWNFFICTVFSEKVIKSWQFSQFTNSSMVLGAQLKSQQPFLKCRLLLMMNKILTWCKVFHILVYLLSIWDVSNRLKLFLKTIVIFLQEKNELLYRIIWNRSSKLLVLNENHIRISEINWHSFEGDINNLLSFTQNTCFLLWNQEFGWMKHKKKIFKRTN